MEKTFYAVRKADDKSIRLPKLIAQSIIDIDNAAATLYDGNVYSIEHTDSGTEDYAYGSVEYMSMLFDFCPTLIEGCDILTGMGIEEFF